MTFSKYYTINNILIIIDACQTDTMIKFNFTLPPEFYDLTNPDNKKGHSIKQYLDAGFNIHLTTQNKPQLIKAIGGNFVDGDYCHYAFYMGIAKIGEGFDHCEMNTLDPKYFKLTQEHLDSLVDAEIYYKDIIQ
jgi:hypothetical protein